MGTSDNSQCDDELALVRHDYEGTSRWEHEETDMS